MPKALSEFFYVLISELDELRDVVRAKIALGELFNEW